MTEYEIDQNGIAILTMNMENSAVNLLNGATIARFSEAVDACLGDGKCRGLIITSGKDSFCAGADLNGFQSPGDVE